MSDSLGGSGAATVMPPQWPADPTAFADTAKCPICFTPISTMVCAVCGLDVRMPGLAPVLEAGRSIQRLVGERTEMLVSVRTQQALRDAHTAAVRREQEAARRREDERQAAEQAEAAARAEAARVAAPAPEAAAAPSAAAPAPAPAPADEPRPRAFAHRFSMQFTILSVGVILTSVAAVVFLFWAYLVASLEVRSLIIAVGSIGVLALAWFLRRRGLIVTGEGVGIVAIVLLLLDVWIVRANDAFGSGTIDEAAYYGGTALILAAALAAARRLTGLRSAGYAAAGLAPIGAALFASSFAPEQGSTRFWVGGLAALLVGVAARLLPRSRPATVMTVESGVLGLGAVLGAADALPDLPWHALLTLGVAAGMWGALIAAVPVRARRLRVVCAVVAGGAAALAPVVAATQELALEAGAWVAPAGAGLVTAGIAALRGRIRPNVGGGAVLSAAVVTTIAALPGLLLGVLRAVTVAAAPAGGWLVGGDGAPASYGPVVTGAAAAVAPLAVAVAAGASLFVRRRLGAVPWLPALFLAWAALAAATYPDPALSATADVAIAVVSLGLATRLHGPGLRVVLTTAEMLAGILLLAIAWTDAALFLPTTTAFVAVGVVGAALAPRVWPSASGMPARAIHLAIASAVLCVSAAAVPLWAPAARITLVEPWTSAGPWLVLGSAGVLAAALAVRPLDRVATWAVSAPALLGAAAGLATAATSPASASGAWVPTLVLTVVCGVGVTVDRRSHLRTCLAALLPIAAAVTVWHVLPLLAIDRGLRWVAVSAVALVLTASALLIRVPAGRSTAVALFSSSALVGAAAIAGAAGAPQAWLVVLLAAPIPYLIASIDGEPTAGTSPWRHLAWLTPVLGLVALWTALHQAGAGAVEAYTIPTAAVVSAIAVVLAFRRPAAADPSAARFAGRSALAWTGAGVAVLPSVVAGAESSLRAVLTVCAGVLLLALSPWFATRWRGIPVRLIAVTAGGVAVAGAATVHGVALAMHGDWPADVWAAAALVGGLAAAALAARIAAVPSRVAGAGAGAASLLSAAPPAVLCLHPSVPMWMLLAPIVVLGVVHAATALPTLWPLDAAASRWASLTSVVGLGAVSIAVSGIDPFDPVSILVGASLVTAGILGGRTWLAWTGAAITVLPSVAASDHPALRPLLLVAAAAVVFGVSRWIPRRVGSVPVRTIALAAATGAAVGAAAVRGLAVAADPALVAAEPWAGMPWAAEVWAAIVLVGGLVGAVLLDRLGEVRADVAPWVASSAIAVATLPVLVLLAHGTQPLAVVLPPLLTLAALRVAVCIPGRRPWSHPLVGATAVAASAVVGAVILLLDHIDPFDLVTVTVGASVLVGGALSGRAAAVWAGAAVAVVPSALAGGDSALRPVVLAGVGIALIVAIPWIPRLFRRTPLRLIALCSALTASTGAAAIRAIELGGEAQSGASSSVLPGIAIPVTVAIGAWAAFALAAGLWAVIRRQRHTVTNARLDAALASAVVVASAVPVLLSTDLPRPVLLALAPVVILGMLHVLTALPGIPPLAHRLTVWTVLVTLLVTAGVTMLAGVVDPVDLVTVVAGAAMTTAGAVRMRRDPSLHSWPALGAGLSVLLVPSLVADFGDPQTWRLVSLGVVAFALMLVGVFARLQAPFLLGAGVLAVHGINQLWPMIALAYAQVWWWLWLAIAGVILIVIAATYERQLRFAKRVIGTVAALR
ncbi:hypothetical protein LK09_16155 [Microbacterium mangrovi]|uniref:DUF2157 domain-containing protein n=1 Tax=Microbacterium mangrovi TaxID=1348253 RepID=A0A0B1ZY63_9MICO|nr:hypothetical protein [Microbacterium mangrovi]KHK96170.1 hypothetical protein LK09_16155 [Microbacterium mangrovi]